MVDSTPLRWAQTSKATSTRTTVMKKPAGMQHEDTFADDSLLLPGGEVRGIGSHKKRNRP